MADNDEPMDEPLEEGQLKAKRRRPGEVRELLVDSAREVFAAKGYSGASTREITERADVSEALLFRHFGSKANLFKAAITRPFSEFVTDFVTQWQHQREHPWSDEKLMGDFIEHLFDLLSENRDLVLALIAASAHESDALAADDFEFNLSSLLDELETIGTDEARKRDFTGVDIEVAVRAMAGMVLSMAVFQPWMFSGSRRPSRARIIEEMVAIGLYGVARHVPESD